MANQRQRALMQEALDKSLTPDKLRGLYTEFDHEPEVAAEFNRLKQVDRMLRSAPIERAPQGMALKIMARLAEGLQVEALRRPSSVALAVGLAVVTLVCAPLLIVLGWLLVSTLTNAAALNGVIAGAVGMIGSLAAAVDALATSAQRVLDAYPEAPVLMLTLIPAAVALLARYAWTMRGLRRAEA